MKEHEIDCWADFHSLLYQLFADRDPELGFYSEWLFRGQSDAAWTLETTLDRISGPEMPLFGYFRKISRCLTEIESFSGRAWSLPTAEQYEKQLESASTFTYPLDGETYEYLTFLRHHGFPSPLLDWSRSPYVAVHFAFSIARHEGRVAIFAYREFSGHSKSAWGAEPWIKSIGPFVRTHDRHYLQQIQYTVCVRGERTDCVYAPYLPRPTHRNQDELHKITMPANLREEAMLYLHRHNVTAFSLFNTEDALVETLALREF